MVSSLVHNVAVISALLSRRLLMIKKDLLNTLIDAAVWPTLAALVFGYIMPAIFNLGDNFGPFIFVGSVLTVCMVAAFAAGNIFLYDLEFMRRIDYELTLPVSPAMIFISHILSIFMQSALVTLPIFVVGKMVLMYRFDFSHFSAWRFLVVYAALNMVLASIGLFTVNLARDVEAFKHVWLRFFNLLLWLGCYFFTWKQVYAVQPMCGYLLLLNPITYCMEGLRIAFFGQAGYLPFGVCCVVLVAQTFLIGGLAVKLLSRRLDCV